MADPISAVIAVITKVVSAVSAWAAASKVVMAIVKIATLVAAFGISKKTPKGSIDQGTELKLKIDSTMPRQIAIGRTSTGGSLVATFTHTTSADTPNNMLERVIALSDFPIYGLSNIRVDGTDLTFEGDVTTGRYACDQYRAKDGSARMWVRVYLGSFTPTADAYLVGAMPGVWTSSHKGVGIAYAVVTKQYDADAFPNGEPELEFQLQGAKIYDDRYDGSKPSRTGSQRLNDPTSWVYSENTAVQIAQYLRGFYINGKLIMGVGASETDFSDAMLVAAYNDCDTAVPSLVSGVNEPRYRSGMMITAIEDASSILPHFITAFDGNVYDRGGIISIVPGAVRTSVITITDDDILADKEKSWQPKATQDALYNYITGTYVDGAKGFIENAYPTKYSPTWEADDGGQRFEKSISFKAVPYLSQVQRITERMHRLSRYQGIAAFSNQVIAGRLEQGDWFIMQSDRWGINKLMQVDTININADLTINIVGKEVHSSLDTFVFADYAVNNADYYSQPSRTNPIPTLTITAGVTTDGVTDYTTPRFTVAVGNINIDGPSDQVVIEYKPTVAGTPVFTKTVSASGNLSVAIVEGIAARTTYSFRARTISANNGDSDWTSWASVSNADASVTYPDVTGDNVAAAIIGQGALALLNQANTAQIAPNAVTVPSDYNSNSDLLIPPTISNTSVTFGTRLGAWTDVLTFTVASDGDPVIGLINFYIEQQAPSGSYGGVYWMHARIMKNGTIPIGGENLIITNASWFNKSFANICNMFKDVPSAGTVTYTVQLASSGWESTGDTNLLRSHVGNRGLVLLQTKR